MMSQPIFPRVDPDWIEAKPSERAIAGLRLSRRLRRIGRYWLQVEGVLPDWIGLPERAAILPCRSKSTNLHARTPTGNSCRARTLATPRPTSTPFPADAPESGFALDCPRIAKGQTSTIAVGRSTTPNRTQGAS